MKVNLLVKSSTKTFALLGIPLKTLHYAALLCPSDSCGGVFTKQQQGSIFAKQNEKCTLHQRSGVVLHFMGTPSETKY
jgi:hypothetical protein